MPGVIDAVAELLSLFAGVALADPLSAALLLAGTVLFAATFGVAGWLALGAAVEFVAALVA